MRNFSFFKNISRTRLALAAILAFAFCIRLAGIRYGLPLQVVDDEPPFTLATLLMLQLKTVLPALHVADFSRVLYYPPYLSYLYLIPFGALGLAHYLAFHGAAAQFSYYLMAHVDQFFLIARGVSVLLGTVSVWLAYRISLSLFKNTDAALISAFLLATSLAHILFSFTGRHWLPISFMYMLGFYFLTRENWSLEKRYCTALITAGIGMGVSPIVGLFTPLIALWYFLYDRKSFGELRAYRGIILSAVFFIALAALPNLLYPRSLGFTGDVTAEQVKTFLGLLSSAIIFLKPIFLSDITIGIFSVIGLAAVARLQKRLAAICIVFICGYSAVFYLLFRFEYRFALPLVPFLCILAGYGMEKISGYLFAERGYLLSVIFLIFPLIFALRFGFLVMENDSRIVMRQWIEANIPAGAKVMVYARLMRLASVPDAIAEQRGIDAGSLRSIDTAEEHGFADAPAYHALNLYSVSNPSFYAHAAEYAKSHGYAYLVISDSDAERDPEGYGSMQALARTGTLIAAYGDSQETYSIAIGQLLDNPFGLFTLQQFGPSVELYRLHQ